MTQYQVGFYFPDGDIKSARIFANYENAMDEYLDRLKSEFHKLGRISTTLGIGYIEDGELTCIEKLSFIKN